jgi:4,4'-diaponeurosporenoate glycosyltransferase
MSIDLNTILVFVFWSFGFFFFWKIPLPSTNMHPGKGRLPAISIIIPARNESENIGALLSSLKNQNDRLKEVIVVDDHSEDNTADIARELGAIVLSSKTLPDGWSGKPWACWQGAKESKGEILMFLDADTILEKGGIESIVWTFMHLGGLVSVQPYHRMKCLYEQLSAYFSIITMAGMNAFNLFRNTSRVIGAFGPCVVCSREDYFLIGGHEKVKGAILENLALGKEFLIAGKRVHCLGGGKGYISFRMYPNGLSSIIEGFGKGFAIGANAMHIPSLLLIVCWISGGMSLTRHLVQAVIAGSNPAVFVWIFLYLIFAAQLYWMLARIGSYRWYTAFFFPVPLVFFVVIFFWSCISTYIIRSVQWKGRTIET